MDNQVIALVLSLVGATAFGIAAWSLADVQQRFVRSGGAHTSTGGRLPLTFRILMPYIKAFSKVITRFLRRRGIIREDDRGAGGTPPWEGSETSAPTVRKPHHGRGSTLTWLYDRTGDRLLAAGGPYAFEVPDYWGFIIVVVVLFTLLGLVVTLMTGWTLLLFAFFGMGAILPFAWLSDFIRRRQNRVRKDLPFALDLLTLSVEAGMDFTAALGNIAERLKASPLAGEFDQTVKEINIGKQRADALRDMGRRLNMSEVNSVVSALIQADQLGTGLGEVLRLQADDVRTRRFQNAEKRAGETPTKMLFPLVAFIFPVTFLMVASPLLVQVIRHLLSGR